jgi:hypothetical protein
MFLLSGSNAVVLGSAQLEHRNIPTCADQHSAVFAKRLCSAL